LLGVLARGENDVAVDDDGCLVSTHADTPSEGGEQFTYVSSSLPGLCAQAPETSICRQECAEPCEALLPTSGCSFSGSNGPAGWAGILATILLMGLRLHGRARLGDHAPTIGDAGSWRRGRRKGPIDSSGRCSGRRRVLHIPGQKR
jgi:hypothetical protein